MSAVQALKILVGDDDVGIECELKIRGAGADVGNEPPGSGIEIRVITKLGAQTRDHDRNESANLGTNGEPVRVQPDVAAAIIREGDRVVPGHGSGGSPDGKLCKMQRLRPFAINLVAEIVMVARGKHGFFKVSMHNKRAVLGRDASGDQEEQCRDTVGSFG